MNVRPGLMPINKNNIRPFYVVISEPPIEDVADIFIQDFEGYPPILKT